MTDDVYIYMYIYIYIYIYRQANRQAMLFCLPSLQTSLCVCITYILNWCDAVWENKNLNLKYLYCFGTKLPPKTMLTIVILTLRNNRVNTRQPSIAWTSVTIAVNCFECAFCWSNHIFLSMVGVCQLTIACTLASVADTFIAEKSCSC